MKESDLEKFKARVKQLNEQTQKQTTFDVPFLVRVVNEIEQLTSTKTQQVLYSGGKFRD